LELSQIYTPIQEDLYKVRDTLRSISNVDFTWLSEQLSHVVRETGKGIRPAARWPQLAGGKAMQPPVIYQPPVVGLKTRPVVTNLPLAVAGVT